ncbi:MAG: DUF2933 domain-containing protein [Burkholderiales bacterium]|nr:DUF2933 domain-containing protein [Burkholderiales bacterium]
MNPEQQSPHRPPEESRFKWVLIAFLLIGGYFLVTEHRAHLSTWLSSYGIWLLLLACPLLHVFMHGSHGGPGNHRGDERSRSDARRKE